MTIAKLTALVLVALGLALIAAGCGGGDDPQIPRDEARNIVRRLQEADRRMSQEPPVCGDLAEDTIPALEDQIANLPEETDDGVEETLREGVEHLRSLIEAECAARREEPDETTTTTEEEPTTTTEPPTTTTEPPTTTETTPTTPTPTTPTPPEQPGNNGNGNGSGGQGVPDGGVSPKRQKKDED